ncbi:MAG: hypothetical protein ACRELG_00260 [Gemmataceae bacterium]
MNLPALKMPKLGGNDATMLALGIVALVVVYYIGKQLLTGAANVVGGVATGNNAITAGTPYAGAGVLGTLGAATNDVSGGVLGNIGGWLGDEAANVSDYFTEPAAATSVDATGGS